MPWLVLVLLASTFIALLRGGRLSNFKNEFKGCGPFLHNDPQNRPAEIFGGTTTLHFGRGKAPYLLLPIIPPKKQAGRKTRGTK